MVPKPSKGKKDDKAKMRVPKPKSKKEDKAKM